MKQEKLKKLEKTSWKVGSVDEFLDLSPKELELIEKRRALKKQGDGCKELKKRKIIEG